MRIVINQMSILNLLLIDGVIITNCAKTAIKGSTKNYAITLHLNLERRKYLKNSMYMLIAKGPLLLWDLQTVLVYRPM